MPRSGSSRVPLTAYPVFFSMWSWKHQLEMEKKTGGRQLAGDLLKNLMSVDLLPFFCHKKSLAPAPSKESPCRMITLWPTPENI